MDITTEVIEKATILSGVLLRNYRGKINIAYLDADDELGVGIKLTFKPKGSGVHVKADLNFIAERVKDSAQDTVMPGRQLSLEFQTASSRPRVFCGTTEGARRRARWYRGR